MEEHGWMDILKNCQIVQKWFHAFNLNLIFVLLKLNSCKIHSFYKTVNIWELFCFLLRGNRVYFKLLNLRSVCFITSMWRHIEPTSVQYGSVVNNHLSVCFELFKSLVLSFRQILKESQILKRNLFRRRTRTKSPLTCWVCVRWVIQKRLPHTHPPPLWQELDVMHALPQHSPACLTKSCKMVICKPFPVLKTQVKFICIGPFLILLTFSCVMCLHHWTVHNTM